MSPLSADLGDPALGAGPADACRRIERWLLDSGVQLPDGPHAGGVAGWLEPDGRPAFVYLEITGYYLTAVAWLAEGGGSGERRADALARGRAALGWLRRVTADGALPPTRIHLSDERDWRNAADFTFDLAMAIRGAALFGAHVSPEEAEPAVRALADRLREVAGPGPRLASHALRPRAAPLDDRWSTRPGPHHVKAAAALLTLPDGVLEPWLVAASRATVDHWVREMRAGWPCAELHPLLYGVEGVVTLRPEPTPAERDLVEELLLRLLGLQADDGTLPADVDDAQGLVRSDVLAQALRIGGILRGWDRLAGESATRLDPLARALLRRVRSDGGVSFAEGQERANAWCAMFALQALSLHPMPGARRTVGETARLLV